VVQGKLSPLPTGRQALKGRDYCGNFKYLWIGFSQIRERMIWGFK